MSLRSTILGAACVVAVAAVSGPAFADMGSGFSGTLQGDYSNISAGGSSGSANVWGGAGSAAWGIGGTGLKIQIDGGYHEVSDHGSIGDWDVDGALIWQSGWGRLGATGGYNGFDGGGFNANITNYGGFAEWYAGHMFTLGVKGGGASLSSNIGGGSADYVGGEGVFYVIPDLALNANIDYLHSGNGGGSITGYGGTAEWLVSEQVPVSVYGGYTYSELSGGGGHLSTWLVGLKFYVNGNGASTLVDRQRSGNANWGTETNLIDAVF